jgi:CheY-like chemotaxis protein
MAAEGVIDADLDLVALEAERALSHGTLTAGRYVRLSVRDSGHGMDAATLERIFEPFFTTKAVGAGTGLGLAMVHGIVSDHGGAMDVRSTPGAGSSFDAYFRQAEAPLAHDDGSAAPLPLGRGETILFIDDERPLVTLGEEMLAAVGYEPVGFDKSSAALAAFRAEPDRFDLVLTDELMPELTGTELATAVHEIRPNLPIILMTGHGTLVEAQEVRAAGIREVLKKPLLSADLAQGLARHLAVSQHGYSR